MTTVLNEFELAEGWKELPFRAIAKKVSESGHPDLESLSVFLDSGVVPRSSREDNHNQLGESLEKYQRVMPNDLVFNKLRTWQGGFGISKYEGIVSPAYIITRPNLSLVDPRFLGFLLKSRPYLSELTRLSKWMPPTQFDISWESIRDLKVRLPDIEEQRRIAVALESRIDLLNSLISVKRKIILNIEEVWQSRLRDAYVESNFTSVPLKFYAWWQEGPGIMAEDFRSSGVPIMRISHVRTEPFNLEGCQFVEEELANRKWPKYFAKIGDLIISASASTEAIATEVNEALAGSIPYTGLIRIKSTNSALSNDYLRFFLMSPLFWNQVERLKQGIGIQHWGPSHLSQVVIPLPELSEQNRIVQGLRSLEEAKKSILKLQRDSIEGLIELKESTITSLVTGEKSESWGRK
jgi:type I restriction enzyme S subunit